MKYKVPIPSQRLSIVNCQLLLLFALIAANLLTGGVAISASELWAALSGDATVSDATRFIVWEARVPQCVTAIFSGAALALAGLVMQTVFSNPLADPSVLGVNAGASLGVAVAMLLLGGSVSVAALSISGFFLTITAAFIGALAVIGLLLLCTLWLRDAVLLLVAGVMISFATSSLISLLSFYATAQGVHAYVIWGLGNFCGVTLERLPLFAGAIALLLLLVGCLVKPLNALLLGESYAANLGVHVRSVRTLLLLITGLLTAIVTALCGPISFIGMAVPHAARYLLRSSDHRSLVPACIILGANVALICQWVSNLPERGMIPLNALTPLLGVPVVLLLIFRKRI